MKRKLPDYTNEQVEKLIADLIHSERDRKILRRRLIDGITYEKLAEEFELSTAQVKRIVCRHEEKIFCR